MLWQKGAFSLPNLADGSGPDYNSMLASLICYLVPNGLKGLLAAGMAAALMNAWRPR